MTRTALLPEASALARLLALRASDPHAILGAHPAAGAVVVRALLPGAEAVSLCIDDEDEARPMERVDPVGLFAAPVGGRTQPFAYRLRIRWPGGVEQTTRDPYAFLPTLGELDLHLLGEGRHERPWEKLGARAIEHAGARGVAFAVWAPNAAAVSVVGDWNGWDGRRHPMRSLGGGGIWELFIPDLGPGAVYKYEVHPEQGPPLAKADPWARRTEEPPKTASIVADAPRPFEDASWMAARHARDPLREPMAIYEVHLGSWRRGEDGRVLGYRELAPLLADHASELGFTHVELMPVMEHPFGGSWGYQVGGYFAPTARWGGPDDLRFLIDHLHRRGIGVILDWVPAHFPKDAHALGRFDGTALYEHLDPRMGEHPDWGTFIFNYGRREVCSFLVANALYWLESFHADGLRVDAVASMLYRDYSRDDGEWEPNVHGGRENLEAIAFMKEVNERVRERCPGALMIAEESTAFGGVSAPVADGGLGFSAKWNMGWMHDTLLYFSKDPIYRQHHHNDLTFSLVYAWTERFILPLSHDEVVHGKGSLLGRMPGDRWQRFANLRALYGHMWAHPGKKMLFMGGEIAQEGEWDHDRSLDWHLLRQPEHAGVRALVGDLNRLYRERPALWEGDVEPAGFGWIDVDNAAQNVIAYLRRSPGGRGPAIACVANLSPHVRHDHRIGLPTPGKWREVLNTDARLYGGTDVGNGGFVEAEAAPMHGFDFSARMTLPPLAVLWLEEPDGRARP